jgi:radical SAM protein with 4Fe4S-binding SPASM domain
VDPTRVRDYDAARALAGQPFRSACYAPFVSLYFHSNGDVVACCKSTHHRLGNVARQRLPEIWSGERVAALRAALRRYELGAACRFCRWQIESGHGNVHAKIFDELPAADGDAAWPARMDFTLSNACNLACVMCYGELSSTIRAQRDQLPPLRSPYGDAFFRDLRPFLAQLRHATFLGGEPFLAAENHRVWDLLIEDRIAPRCHVITNGTQWNERVERVLDALPMDVSVSIDGVTAETVERLRVHVRLATLLENVARFRAACHRRGTRMSIMFCLMPQNWHEFGPLLRLAEELDVDVDMNVVVDPPANSLHALPEAELARVVAELTAADRRERFGDLPRNGRVWRGALADLGESLGARSASGASVPAAGSDAADDPLAEAWRRIHAGDPAAARRLLRDATELGDRGYEALLCRAHAERSQRDSAAAESTLREAIALFERGPSAWIELGWLHLDQRRGDAARAAGLAAAERLRPDAAAGTRSAVQRILASASMLSNDVERALAELRAVPATGAGSYDVATTEAWICRAAGRFEEAQRAIDRALRLEPDRSQAHVELAWLRLAQGRPEEALRAVDAAGAGSNVEMARAACLRATSEGSGTDGSA